MSSKPSHGGGRGDDASGLALEEGGWGVGAGGWEDAEILTASVELSSKIVDNEHRLRSTLAHELCHVAQWVVNREAKPAHGEAFREWADRVCECVCVCVCVHTHTKTCTHTHTHTHTHINVCVCVCVCVCAHTHGRYKHTTKHWK
jgi:hypothetical protein